jgi:hypothetical protein
MDAFWQMRKLYDSMNFPSIPLEESLAHSKGKRVLQNAMLHLMGGYTGRRVGQDSPSVPESEWTS